MTKRKYYLEWLRVREVVLMLGFPIVGIFFALEKITISVVLRSLSFLLATLFLFLAIYSFNSYCGYTSDLGNLRLSHIQETPQKRFLRICLVCMVASLSIYFFLSSGLFLMGGISVILWFFYSLPKIGLKNFPLLGTVLHFISQILHFQMGFYLLSPLSLYSILVAIYFAFLFAGGHIHHEMIDYEADKKSGIITGAVYFGKHNAFDLSLFLFFVSGLYWMGLYKCHIVKLWEFLPFFGAFILQACTFIYFRSRIEKAPACLLDNRFLYRVYYIVGGLGYVMIKLIKQV